MQFDPSRHLCYRAPTKRYTLSELGLSPTESNQTINNSKPLTDFAFTEPFPLITPEGVKVCGYRGSAVKCVAISLPCGRIAVCDEGWRCSIRTCARCSDAQIVGINCRLQCRALGRVSLHCREAPLMLSWIESNCSVGAVPACGHLLQRCAGELCLPSGGCKQECLQSLVRPGCSSEVSTFQLNQINACPGG